MQAFVLAFLTWLLIVLPPLQAGDLDPGYWESSPLPQMGVATYYAPGVMEWVRNYRREQGEIADCPDCVGAVALLRAGDIGRKVWLQPPGGELAGPFIVVDCARDTDIPALLDRNWAVDVGYDLGQLWGMTGPLDDVIVWADPGEPATGAVRPAGRPLPAYIDPSQVVISSPTATRAPSDPSPTRMPALPTRMPRQLASVTPKPVLPPVLPPPVAGTPTITVPTPTLGGDGASAPALPPTATAAVSRLPATPAAVSSLAASPAVEASPAATAQLPILAVLATASASQRATAQVSRVGAPGGDISNGSPPDGGQPDGGQPNGGQPDGGSPSGDAPGSSSVAIGRPGAELLARPAVLRTSTAGPTPTRDPARPTSLPILPPGTTPALNTAAPGLVTPPPLSPLDQLWHTLLDLLGR